MRNLLIEAITKEQLKPSISPFNVGDTVSIDVLIQDGEKSRIQKFEGVVIAKKNGGIEETFTVRKISSGVGVERIFPLHSPNVKNIVVTRKGKVRRAKLYYLRNLTGKAARIKEAK